MGRKTYIKMKYISNDSLSREEKLALDIIHVQGKSYASLIKDLIKFRNMKAFRHLYLRYFLEKEPYHIGYHIAGFLSAMHDDGYSSSRKSFLANILSGTDIRDISMPPEAV